jgi:hypothetical protein
MKHCVIVACIVVLSLAVPAVHAQETVGPASAQKSLAATMNVYVFPSKGQTPAQQSTDEGTCYSWAVNQTGTDPFQLQKQSEAEQQQARAAAAQAGAVGTGAGAVGAVRGAAAGTLIGAIAGDTGKGAAYGAAAGLLVGHRRKRMARYEAQMQVAVQEQQAQQATATELANFKKAFSVCLEAKDYMVKY